MPTSSIQVESASPDGDASDESPDSGDDKILSEARARFSLCKEAEQESRLLAAEDRRFRKGDQWPEDIKAAREADSRPCLTINKMPQFEQQVTNDQRQNRPAIKVHPVDDKADVETAKVYQGIIKSIEVNSNADTARDTAFENAVRGSYGFYRIVTEYSDPAGFEQDIRVKRIRDADSVYLDPNHQEPDGSDAEYGFVFDWMPRDKFLAEYGETKLKGATEWDLGSSAAPDWIRKDSIMVAEYFYKEYTTKHLVLFSDGRIVDKSEADVYAGTSKAEPVKERSARIPTVRWCKLNGTEVLDKTDWPGQWIPILPVYGAEIVVDGKVIRESLIRHAKDPARMYNFWKSAETEAITLAPKAPFIAAEGQLEGKEAEWSSANRRNHAFLTYKPISVGGTPVPPPQRSSVEPPVQAITQASMLAADEVKSVLGIYDASLGARSNETSGVAIQRRNQQAQTSNFHFTDNLNRTIRHEGRIIIDLIPHIYDTARAARITGEDGEQKAVRVNDPAAPGDHGKPYMLALGKYDCTVDTGPSYATRRQEAADSMLQMSKAVPQIPQVAGDLIVKNMDWPGASDIAERIKKSLPPGIADDPKDKSKQVPPQVQAQMQQMGQLIEQLTAQLHDAHDAIDTKRVELESRERIEMAKLETTATIEMAKLQSKEALNMLAHQIAELDQRTQMLGMGQPFPSGEPAAEESQEQFSPAPDDGAYGADSMGAEQPTGGQSPGESNEGDFE